MSLIVTLNPKPHSILICSTFGIWNEKIKNHKQEKFKVVNIEIIPIIKPMILVCFDQTIAIFMLYKNNIPRLI